MSWFTVTIPTRNSAAWIGALLRFYAGNGITPVILLDSRTRDDTAAIAAAHGCRVVPVQDFRFTEGVVALTRHCVRTPWCLFLHDDEAPSAALLRWMRGPPPPTEASSIAIARRWAAFEPGQSLQYGTNPDWPDRAGQGGLDHMWRLFRPDRVRFTAAVHSDGILIEQWARLPPALFFVHFEWVLRTFEQRVMKLRGYDRHRYGYGLFFERLYLPERSPPGAIRFAPLEELGLDALAVAYHAARDTGVRIGPKTIADHYTRLRFRLRTALVPPRFDVEPADRKGLTPKAENEVALSPRPGDRDDDAAG